MAQDRIPTRVESAVATRKSVPTADAPKAGSAPDETRQAAAPAGEAGAPTSQAQPDGAPSPSVLSRAAAWLAETFPNSRHAVIGGICGLVVAIMLFTIGVWETVVIVLFILIGVAAGQFLDGDPKIVRVIQSLLKKR